MKNRLEERVSLVDTQVKFLDEIVEKYELPDKGKAIRCLIDFARINSAEHDRLFKEVRCLDC